MISRSVGFSSFSLELFHQLAREPELAPDDKMQPPSPLNIVEGDPSHCEESRGQESEIKNTADERPDDSVVPCENSQPMASDQATDLPPEKRQKVEFDPPSRTAECEVDPLRLWSTWQHPTVFTVTILFGDPDKPFPSAKHMKKEEIIQQLIQRKFPADRCRGKKEELLRRLQEDIPYQQFQIDGREDLSRCIAMACSTWSWPFEISFSTTMPFRGSNVLGVKHFFDIFGDSFLNAKYKISNDAHMKTIRTAIRSSLPRLKEADIEQLTSIIAQNQLQGELLSDVRQLTGMASLCGHRYREVNGRERTFHLDLNTLALQKGDVVDLELTHRGCNVSLVLRIDGVDNNIPVVPEVSLESRGKLLPTRARLLKRSWHPSPSLPDISFSRMKAINDRNMPPDQPLPEANMTYTDN